MKKRVLSLLLVLCMLLGLLPSAALAAPMGDELPEVPEDEIPASLFATTGQITGAGNLTITLDTGSAHAHHGGDWNDGFQPYEGESRLASYDNGTVEVRYGNQIYTKERDKFKNADYLWLPFTLSADVPAHSAITYNFTIILWHKRNSKGGVHYWVELLDNQNSRQGLNTGNNGTPSSGSLGRLRHESKDGGNKTFDWSVTFENYDGSSTKTIQRKMAYYVGASKSGSALTSYHHQVESSITFGLKNSSVRKRITYNNNGGSGSTLAQMFTQRYIQLAPSPTRTGYDFQGWKDSIDGRLYVGNGEFSEARGAAMTAQWRAKSLNVTFDPNGGTVSQSQKSVTYGGTYGALPTPTRTGYQFEGWTSGPTGGQVFYAHTKVTETENHTLYAYWTVKVPTVTFNAGGGSVSQTSKRAVYGDPYGALPTPTRTGYTFDGWYTAQTGGNKVESTTKVANGDNHTLYARWTPKTVAVTLKYNDGATADGSLNLTYGGKYTGLTDPTRAGYAFTGWYTAASGGSRVTADTAVTNANAHTLYARWNRTTYTITFNANGGSAVESRKVNAGDKLGTLPTSTKAGYTLAGWGDGVTKDTVPTGDVTYTAKWTANQYKVTFDPNGGKVSQTSMTVTSGLTYGTLPTPTRTGYTFNGWFTAATGGQEMTYNTYFQKAANQTLYAHWTANKYRAYFNPNDGGSYDFGTMGDQEVIYDGVYGNLLTPTRTGYTFDGWFTAPVGGTQVTAATKVTATDRHILYAHWTAKPMTVSFDANGGEFPSEATTAKTVTFGQPYGSLPVPTRTGKTFVGWYTAADSGAFRDANSLVNTDSDHTLYAHWGDTHSHILGAGFTNSSASFIALGQTAGSDKTAVSDVLGKEFRGTNSYFLTENVEIDTTTTVKGTLNLCLNGHSLTYKGTDDSIFVVENGGTLRICDCNGSHDSHTFTSPATGESVTISGGLITRSQPKTSVGTAIRVLGQGTLHLCNGTIAGIATVTDKDSHGAVRVEGTFYMHGGEICHNKIGCGAAVNICDIGETKSVFYLKGGSIHHNYASLDDGGGICVNENAACTISGGSIEDNRAKSGGGGIHSYGGSIRLSGGTISGNTVGESASSKTPSDIRLDQVKDSEGNFIRDAKLTVSEGFSSAKPIGVSAVSAPTADSPVAVGTAGSGAYARYFVADAAGQEVVDDNGVLSLKLHSHPVCGDGCSDHDGHTDVEYTALTQAMVDRLYNSTLSAGNYFLAEDITTPRTFSVQQGATVSLCLNGHTLETTRDSNGSNVITVSCSSSDSHSALNVCDCQGTGKVRAATCSGYYVSYNSSVNLYGGGLESRGTAASVLNDASLTVDGASLTSTESSGVYLNGTAKLLLKNGSITATADGKYGVNMSATGVSVQISGGSVSGGAESAVYVKEASTLTLSGSPTIHATGDHDIYLNKSQAKIAAGDDLAGTYRLKMGYSATESFSPTITTASGRDHSAHFVLPGGSDYESLGLRDVENGDGTHTLQLYKKHLHDGVEYEYTPLTAGTTLTDGGHYLLTADATWEPTVPVGATVDLCLNGHSAAKLHANGTLNLWDCTGNGSVKEIVSAASSKGATVHYYSGLINYVAIGNAVRLHRWPTLTGDNPRFWFGQPGYLHIDAALDKPETPLRFYLGNDSNSHNLTDFKAARKIAITTGWSEFMGDADPADFFTPGPNVTAKVVVEDGEAVLRYLQVNVGGTVCYPAYDAADGYTPGTLTDADLAEPETRVGYLWDGWYTAEEGGDKVTAGTVFTDDATLYPRWTACDHSGNTTTPTTVEDTCTTAGSSTYTCSVCGLEVTTETAAQGHDFDTDKTWHKDDPDSGVHYHKCSRCDQRQDEAEHTWGETGTVTTAPTADADGVMTFTCAVCSATTTVAIPALVAHAVTYEVDDYTVGEIPTQADTVKGGSFSLPADGLTRTGYTLAGWALLDADGVPTADEDGKEVLYTGTFTMPDRDVTFQVRWARVPNYELQPGDTIVLEDGTVIKNETGGTVTIDQNGDGAADTTITLPDGTTTVTIQEGQDGGKDKVTVPPGAQVETTPAEGEKGPVITIGQGGDGTVDPSGKVDAPVGTTIKDKDGNTITITEGSGGQIDPDGVVTFPEGGKVTVTDKDGNTTEVDVPGGGEGAEVAPGGLLMVNDPSGTVTLVDPDGGGVTTITVPGDGVITDNDDGSYTVPGGSSVTKTDGEGNQTQLTLPSGGQVEEGGSVTLPEGGQVKVTDQDGTVTTITVPAGGSVGTDEDGNVVAPPGSSVTNPDGTTTELPNGGTVEPGGGSVEVIHTWGKWTLQSDGVTLRRVCSTNTTHVQTATLAVSVDEGPFVYNGAAHKPEVTLTADETALTLGRDYTVAYQSNVSAGTGKITITGQGSYELSLERTFAIDKATPPQAAPGHFNITNGVEREYNYLLSLLCPQINEDVVTADRKEWGERVYTVEDVSFTEDGYYDADKAPAYIGRAQESGAYINRLYLPIQAASSRTEGQVGTVTVKISSANYEDFTNTVAVMATSKAAVDFTGFTTPDKTYDGHPYEYEGAVKVRDSDGYTVRADVEITYAGRGDTGYAERETPPVNAGEFAMIVRVADSDPNYAGRRSSNFVIRKAPGQGSVTMEDYTEGQRATEPVPVSETNGVEHVSYQYKAKGGSDETYTAVKPTRAGEYTVRATFAATLNYTEATATADFTVSKAALPDDPNALKPGQSVDLPGGGSVENKGDGTVEITDKDGSKTTVTLPQDGDGAVKVDKDTGAVTLPGGSTVTLPDGQGGKTEVTLPENGGAVKPTGDGKVEVPAGSTVQKPDGSTVTVPDGGGVIDPATGDVEPLPGGGVVVTPGESVDIPGGGTVSKDPDTGDVTITPPANDPSGAATTITPGNGGDVTVDPDTGEITIPGGSTVKTGDNGPEITVGDQGGKVDGDGTVTVPGGSTITIPDGKGGKTEITLPGGAESEVKPTEDGKVQVPEGSTVKKPDGSTVTVPSGGGLIDPATGDVTPVKPDEPTPPSPSAPPTPSRPSGSSSTSSKPSVSASGKGGKVEADRNGNVTITPDRGYVIDTITVNGKEVTVPADGKLTGLTRTDQVVVTFKEVPTVTVEQFTDVKPTDWFYDSVKTIVEQGLMNGTGETTFAPTTDTSRAMIATILWRLAGSPAPKAELTYPDCVRDSWYARAVAWAAENSVVKGYGDGSFGPEDPITREQLAVMLWRYAQFKGLDVSQGEDANILSYTDVDQAGEWAIPALQWAVGSGVMKGKGGSVLDPQGQATRAEVATMLTRFSRSEA